jgi:hypothetical protein
MNFVSGEIPQREWRLSVRTHLDGRSAHPACVHDDFVVRVGQVSNDGLPETHVGEVCEGGDCRGRSDPARFSDAESASCVRQVHYCTHHLRCQDPRRAV